MEQQSHPAPCEEAQPVQPAVSAPSALSASSEGAVQAAAAAVTEAAAAPAKPAASVPATEGTAEITQQQEQQGQREVSPPEQQTSAPSTLPVAAAQSIAELASAFIASAMPMMGQEFADVPSTASGAPIFTTRVPLQSNTAASSGNSSSTASPASIHSHLHQAFMQTGAGGPMFTTNTSSTIAGTSAAGAAPQEQQQQQEAPAPMVVEEEIPVLPDRMERAERQAAEGILAYLFDPHYLRHLQWFYDPVNPAAWGLDNYFDIIKNPMDLGTVRRKLRMNEYETLMQVVTDIRLIVWNCYTFNGTKSDISEEASFLETQLEQKLALLSRSLRDKVGLAATLELWAGKGGQQEEAEDAGGRKSRRAATKTFPSVLKWVEHGETSAENQARKLKVNEQRQALEKLEEDIKSWETEMAPSLAKIQSMWEIPSIGQFLFLTHDFIGVEYINFVELEYGFTHVQSSSYLGSIFAALLFSGLSNDKRRGKQAYSEWSEELRRVVASWYKLYDYYFSDRVFNEQGVEVLPPGLPKRGGSVVFSLVDELGESNPLEHFQLHELPVEYQVVLLMALCHDRMEWDLELAAKMSGDKEYFRPDAVGKDSLGFSYFFFPHFLQTNFRLYRQGPFVRAQKSQKRGLKASFLAKVEAAKAAAEAAAASTTTTTTTTADAPQVTDGEDSQQQQQQQQDGGEPEGEEEKSTSKKATKKKKKDVEEDADQEAGGEEDAASETPAKKGKYEEAEEQDDRAMDVDQPSTPKPEDTPSREGTRRSSRARSTVIRTPAPETPKSASKQSSARTATPKQATPKAKRAKEEDEEDETNPFHPLPERDSFEIVCPDLESFGLFLADLKGSKGTHDRALCEALETLSQQYSGSIFDGALRPVQRKAKQRCLEDLQSWRKNAAKTVASQDESVATQPAVEPPS